MCCQQTRWVTIGTLITKRNRIRSTSSWSHKHSPHLNSNNSNTFFYSILFKIRCLMIVFVSVFSDFVTGRFCCCCFGHYVKQDTEVSHSTLKCLCAAASFRLARTEWKVCKYQRMSSSPLFLIYCAVDESSVKLHRCYSSPFYRLIVLVSERGINTSPEGIQRQEKPCWTNATWS